MKKVFGQKKSSLNRCVGFLGQLRSHVSGVAEITYLFLHMKLKLIDRQKSYFNVIHVSPYTYKLAVFRDIGMEYKNLIPKHIIIRDNCKRKYRSSLALNLLNLNPPSIFGTLHHYCKDLKLVSQQYRVWSDCRMFTKSIRKLPS